MYPYKIIFGMTLYEIMFVLGFLSAVIYFRITCDKKKVPTALYNLILISATIGIFVGYGASVVTQAFYNFMQSGVFEITESTGATFYGGLIGGCLCFAGLYFLLGKLFCKNVPYREKFYDMVNLGCPGIAIAHGFGRIGCLTAGCCHGKITTEWYGVWNEYLGAKTVPTQLFETIFLFALSAFMIVLFYRGKKYNPSVYLCSYAVFRFFLEYLRDDDRGATVLSFLTPSQLTAVLLFLCGALWAILLYQRRKKNAQKASLSPNQTGTEDVTDTEETAK